MAVFPRLVIGLLAASCTLASAQGPDPAATLGLQALGKGFRWESGEVDPRLFLPPLEGARGGLVLEPGLDHRLDIGLFRKDLSVAGRVEEGSGGRLEVALFTDEERSRGLLVEVAAPGERPTVRVRRLLSRGVQELGRVARGPRTTGAVRFRVEVSDDRLRVAWAGVPLFGDEGLGVRGLTAPGRLVLSARGAPLALEELQVAGELTRESRQRLRFRAAVAVPSLPSLPAITLADPLEAVPPEDLLAGLGPKEAVLLRALRRRARRGEGLAVLPEIETLASASPDAAGPAFLAGAIRLISGGDARGARPLLERGRKVPGAASLLVDVARMLGDLDGARRHLSGVAAPHDVASHRALLDWVTERRPSGTPVERAAQIPCRRCARRVLLLTGLETLLARPELHRWGRSELVVLSDGSRARARRLHGWAAAFLGAVPSVLGEREAAAPVTVVALSSPVLYDYWNERLGGAYHADTVGIYRPGTGVLILRDDEDAALTRRWLQHELVHHVVHEQGLALPLGFEEGLAEYLAMGTPRGARLAGLERLPRAHLESAARLVESDRLQPAARLFFWDPVRSGLLLRDTYAQGWLALHLAAHGADPAGRVWWKACSAALASGDGPEVEKLLHRAPELEQMLRHLRSLGWPHP